jgi:TonB family protein
VLTSLRASGETEIQPPRDVVNEMRRNGETKTSAVAKLCLAADGSISSVTVVRSTKYPRYDEAILAAMRRWTHRPYVTNGAAAPACGLVTFVYSM